MVEVYKTDVNDPDQASKLLSRIHQTFAGYTANFDLEDCDKILRVKSEGNPIQSESLIVFLKDLGTHAEILSDEIQLPKLMNRDL